MRCKMLLIGFLGTFYLVSVTAVKYSRIDEGFSHGYLYHCPGSWKPAVVKPETLKSIIISVMGSGPLRQATWTPYNYYQIKNLPKHPDVDFSKKTVLYVNGYLDTITIPAGRLLGRSYMELGYNVLILDTNALTARDFPDAVRMMRPVGKHVAEMLAHLTTAGLDPKKLELVGISLGGQTMGFIAKNYRQITGRNISSLTGFDAAGPCFRYVAPDQRLHPSDADFVVNIATNSVMLGIAAPVGHVTFYVNGGEQQIGDNPNMPCGDMCSHIRAYFIWISALINPNDFIGIKCDSVQQARDGDCFDIKPMVTNTLGLFTDRSKPGIYYLATSNRYPFALGQKGLEKKNRSVIKPMKLLGISQMFEVWRAMNEERSKSEVDDLLIRD